MMTLLILMWCGQNMHSIVCRLVWRYLMRCLHPISISVFTVTQPSHNWFCVVDNQAYRQHCAQHIAPVFRLLRWRFWGFSPHRGDTFHRLGWNLAWRSRPNIFLGFTPSLIFFIPSLFPSFPYPSLPFTLPSLFFPILPFPFPSLSSLFLFFPSPFHSIPFSSSLPCRFPFLPFPVLFHPTSFPPVSSAFSFFNRAVGAERVPPVLQRLRSLLRFPSL